MSVFDRTGGCKRSSPSGGFANGIPSRKCIGLGGDTYDRTDMSIPPKNSTLAGRNSVPKMVDWAMLTTGAALTATVKMRKGASISGGIEMGVRMKNLLFPDILAVLLIYPVCICEH